MSQAHYFVKRTLITIALVFLIATGLFFLFRALPGGFLTYAVNQGVPPNQIEALRAKWGLNKPLSVQYFIYLQQLFTADMGNSFIYGVPVFELVKPRIINSFILVAPAITTAYVLGSLYGTIMGNNRGKTIDEYGIIPITIVGAMPEFFVGILLILIFASWLNLFPTSGMLSIEAQTRVGNSLIKRFLSGDFWWHYALPYATIVLRYLYIPSLIMRTSVVEVSGQDFMYYHRIKGLAKSKQMRHLMRHASLPVITLFPASLTRALGGMVLVEVVFNWPGIGSLLVEAVLQRDFPVVQFVFFLVAVFVVFGNYLIDLLYGVIDPRVSIEGESSSS